MNFVNKAMTWFALVSQGIMAGDKTRGFREGKHRKGTTQPRNAAKLRRLKHKLERQARQRHYKRMKA